MIISISYCHYNFPHIYCSDKGQNTVLSDLVPSAMPNDIASALSAACGNVDVAAQRLLGMLLWLCFLTVLNSFFSVGLMFDKYFATLYCMKSIY